MKKITKSFAVLLFMVIALLSFSITVSATDVSEAQNGLIATITTAKDNYKSNEDIKVTFKVTNTNDFAVDNVSIEALIPNGLKLKNQSDTKKDTVSLSANESLELSLVLVKDTLTVVVEPTSLVQPTSQVNQNTVTNNANTTDGNSGNTVATGINVPYLLVGLICLVCLIIAIVAFRFKKKAVKYLALILCLCISATSIAVVGIPNASAEETTQQISFEVSKNITVDNKEYKITAHIYTHQSENADDFIPSRDADQYIDDNLYSTATNKSHIKVNPNSKSKYIDNELILFASDNSNKSDILSLIKNYNGKIVGRAYDAYQIRFSKSYTYDELENIKNIFEQSPLVDECFINSPALEVTTDAYYPKKENNRWNNDWDSIPKGSNWGIEAIKAPEAWEYIDLMQSVNVGVYDAGFDSHHKDFSNLQYAYTGIGVKKDWNDHGTHVAGIIGATYDNGIGIDGVFPKSQLSLINIANASLDKTKFHDVVAMEYLIEKQKSKVVNISLSYDNKSLIYGASQGNNNAVNNINEHAKIIEECLSRLINKGYDFVICQAAGNENDKLFSRNDKADYGYDKKTFFGENKGCNAKFSNVYSAIENTELKNRIIVVGAIENKSDTTAKYSLCNFSNIGDRVDVVAPGYDIESTVSNNGYEWQHINEDGTKSSWAGTSMASPHVAGIAAMLYSLNPDLKGDEVKRIICETATTEVDGYKLVDAEKAVKKVLGQGSIKAQVVSSDNNNPLSDVKVTAYLKLKSGNKLVKTSYTDNSGNISMELQGGGYEIKLEKDGYKTNVITPTITKDTTDLTYTTYPITMEKEEIQNSFKIGKNFLYVNNKYILSDGNSIIVKNSITDSGLKIANLANTEQIMSDGKTVYFTVCLDRLNNYNDEFKSYKVYQVKIDGSNQKQLFVSNGKVDLITCYNDSLYYLDVTDNYKESFNKYNLSNEKNTVFENNAIKEYDTNSIKNAEYIGNKIYFVNQNVNNTNQDSIISFDLTTENSETVLKDVHIGYSEMYSESKLYFSSYIIDENTHIFNNYYIYSIDTENNLSKSKEVPSNLSDIQIVSNDGLFALFFGSNDDFNLYKFDLNTGNINVIQNGAEKFQGKGYKICTDWKNFSDIYFICGKIYKFNGNGFSEMTCEYEPYHELYWIVDSVLINNNFKNYKIS